MGKKNTLIMMRHGQSIWNLHNLFTGWVDVPLSEKGIQESLEGGKKIKDIPIDVIYTTTLVRAQMTAFLAMSQHSSGKVPVVLHPGEGKMESQGNIFGKAAKENIIPVTYCWELNERMYGQLQGLDKAEVAAEYGAEQVKIWRRSFDTPPPGGESLANTASRSVPYFKEKIVPHLQEGRNVFIAAHGNSLRSIIMYLDNLSKDEILSLEIETGMPILYHFENQRFTRA